MNKKQSWNYAIGMIKVDGLEPSKDFQELVEKEKKELITTKDIKKVLDTKYQAKSRG